MSYNPVVTTASHHFTRAEYMRLPEGYPAQLIEGFLVKEPSPIPWHQGVAHRLLFALATQVGQDRVLGAPLDLFLDDANIYQPDIMVFERPLEIRPEDREVERPILVVEVLSPSTAAYDRGEKARRYLEWGVREIWLVDPATRTVEVRTATSSVVTGPGGTAESTAIAGFSVDLAMLFRTGPHLPNR